MFEVHGKRHRKVYNLYLLNDCEKIKHVQFFCLHNAAFLRLFDFSHPI